MPEAVFGLSHAEQSRLILLFTIASVLPPTLVGTAYGMKRQGKPELGPTLGRPLALVVASAVVPCRLFRRNSWLS